MIISEFYPSSELWLTVRLSEVEICLQKKHLK